MIKKINKTIKELNNNSEIGYKNNKTKDSWRNFLIPTKNVRENVSENIHVILYDKEIS